MKPGDKGYVAPSEFVEVGWYRENAKHNVYFYEAGDPPASEGAIHVYRKA